MLNPAKASDNHVYDYKSIKRWLKDHDTSPKTREVLDKNKLTFENELSTEIFKYILKYLKVQNPNLDLIIKLIYDLEDREDEFIVDLTVMLKMKRDQIMSTNNSDSDSDEECTEFKELFNTRELIKEHTYSNQNDVLEILQTYEDDILI
jgi:hypothetical protein